MSADARKVTPIADAPSAPAIPSFYLRLAKIQGEIDRIGKTGRNKEQGYSFVEESAIMDAVKPMLLEAGIFMTMKQVANSAKVDQLVHGKNQTQFFKAEVEVELCLIDGHSDAREVYPAHSYALDTGDKALQKALTSAGKYAVLKAFMISTGVDLDNESQERGDGREVRNGNANAPKATTKQIGFLTTLVVERKLTDKQVGDIALHETGIRTEKLSELTVDGASKLIECIKSDAYLSWVSQTPAESQDDPIINEEQAKKLEAAFAALNASPADIAFNVRNFTKNSPEEPTENIRQMRVSEAAKLWQMLNRREMALAPK